jgi:hypothetical protein
MFGTIVLHPVSNLAVHGDQVYGPKNTIRPAHTGGLDFNIGISHRLFFDVCTACAGETGVKSRNVKTRINDV